VADESALTEVVARIAEERIGVTELSLRLPSLDEVFYALTGRPTHDDTDRDDEREVAA
jgi:oleandomycin transport system ATP-binding protein